MSSPSGSSPGASGAPQMPPGPPYPPQVASVGGIPTAVDILISAVILTLFIVSAVLNMTIFQSNNRRTPRSHKFIPSVLLFGFSMARIAAMTLRIVWATRRTNVSIALAANVFVAAGVLILFLLNLLFAQRLLRAYHPKMGWHKTVKVAFRAMYVCVGALLVMVITATVYSFFTLSVKARQQCRDVQLFAGTFLAVLAFLPIPIVIAAVLWRTPPNHRVDKFGTGRLRTKVALVLFTSILLTAGAGFRLGTSFATRPINDPAWYHSRAAFYCFNFAIELVVVYTYTLMRFDRRFHVPDGSSGPGHYSGWGHEKAKESFRGESGETAARPITPMDEVKMPSPTKRGSMRAEWEADVKQHLDEDPTKQTV